MNRSESITNLTKALFKFQSEMRTISKDSVNPHFNSKYASLSAILDGIREPLINSSLVIMQTPGTQGDEVSVTTIVMHADSGEHIESTFSMTPVLKEVNYVVDEYGKKKKEVKFTVARDPHAIGSCISYIKRYSLSAILNLNVDGDDDGNYASSVSGNYSYVNNKVDNSAKKRSKEFLEIQTAITKSKTIDELNEAVSIINDIIEADKEKADLRVLYIQQKDKVK